VGTWSTSGAARFTNRPALGFGHKAQGSAADEAISHRFARTPAASSNASKCGPAPALTVNEVLAKESLDQIESELFEVTEREVCEVFAQNGQEVAKALRLSSMRPALYPAMREAARFSTGTS
jgi:hypothetical protein